MPQPLRIDGFAIEKRLDDGVGFGDGLRSRRFGSGHKASQWERSAAYRPFQRCAQLQPRAMQPRSHGIGSQLARRGNLVVGQAAGLAHQEHVAVERRQPVERLGQRRGQFLRRRRRPLVELDGDAATPVVADVIQRQVARDAEDPRAARARFRRRQRTARDAQKDFLRQLAGVSLADDAAQVTEDAVAMRREQDV